MARALQTPKRKMTQERESETEKNGKEMSMPKSRGMGSVVK